MGKMISPSGHGRRFHVSMLILALFTVGLASPMATTSDAYANDDLKEPLASREVNFLFRGRPPRLLSHADRSSSRRYHT